MAISVARIYPPEEHGPGVSKGQGAHQAVCIIKVAHLQHNNVIHSGVTSHQTHPGHHPSTGAAHPTNEPVDLYMLYIGIQLMEGNTVGRQLADL
jgi:hypothetical protein